MRCKNETAVLAAAVAALFALPAVGAEGPRYTYADIGYVDLDVDDVSGFDIDGDGFSIAGSVALADNWHIFAGYDDAELDVDGGEGLSGSVDLQDLSIGVGFNTGVTDTIDFVARLWFVDRDLEFFDDNGYGLGAGVRAMVMPKLELNGAIEYTDIGDFEDDTALVLGGVYNFTDVFAATAGVTFSDDITQYGIGVRAYFGK